MLERFRCVEVQRLSSARGRTAYAARPKESGPALARSQPTQQNPVASHRDLERLLVGFNSAYNARRQRVLGGRSPDEIVRKHLARDRGLANPSYRPLSDPCLMPKALLVIKRAKDVSQPDSLVDGAT